MDKKENSARKSQWHTHHKSRKGRKKDFPQSKVYSKIFI